MIELNPNILLPVFLYAETHYKFKGIYSRLYKKEPEIIADAPFRVEPGKPIPILILIKDANRFPIILESITVRYFVEKNETVKEYSFKQRVADKKWWHKIINLKAPKDCSGQLLVDVAIKIRINGKTKVYHNDNYRISSHQPFNIFVANEHLPTFNDLFFGDFHVHSLFTEDMVEFGAPLDVISEIGRAIGLNFFAVTDHSYDLDDKEDNWLENDPNIPRWHELKKEVKRLNAQNKKFVILPGEEVSAGNSRNKNVHLLVVNNEDFFEGRGDSAERWLRTRPDLTITQILENLEPEALAIAGHPEVAPPFLQRFLIRRGDWEWSDFQHSSLHGFQIWNGVFDSAFKRGSKTWIKLLLEGKKITIVAGNDAHGNFNRFRQIGFPFFTFREQESQVFGKMRTGVFVRDKLNLKSLLTAVKAGHCLVSNGPVADFHITNESGERAAIGEKIFGKELQMHIQAKSTIEFGSLKKIILFFGDLDNKKELKYKTWERFEDGYNFLQTLKIDAVRVSAYFRVEVTAENANAGITRCLTNPVWIEKKS